MQANDPIDQIWTEWKAGRITHAEALRNQAELMPRCRGCGAEPMYDTHSGLGAACYAKMSGRPLPRGDNREVMRPEVRR